MNLRARDDFDVIVFEVVRLGSISVEHKGHAQRSRAFDGWQHVEMCEVEFHRDTTLNSAL